MYQGTGGLEYYKTNGNLLVPSNYKTTKGVSLGDWIGHQRKYYKEKKLDIEKIDLLDKIGMVWKVRKE